MFSIDWDNSLTVGVKQFDEHHKHLFDLLNKIHVSFTGDNRQDELEAVINELIAYTSYHFTAEEHLLGARKHADFSLQKKEHEYFTLKVLEFKRDSINGKMINSTELLWFLGNWLLHHIMDVDKRYSTQL